MAMITRDMVLKDVSKAFKNQEFKAWYQPQYNMSTGMLIGAEALVRWHHPEYGIITPFFFIPVLEENDMISLLDLTVFESVCRFQKEKSEAGSHVVPVSFNLSRKDIYRENFIDEIEEIRARYGVPSSLLRVEVVESIALEGVDRAKGVIDRLHGLGYLVELDDFGSGFSSLNVLKDIAYDILKLDMKFLSEDMEGRAGTIVSSVIRMAKWLKTPVVAEGVETEKQAEYLRSVGCDYAQGYLFSKPIPEEEFAALVKKNTAEMIHPAMDYRITVNPSSFWDHRSVETLVFNNYAGAAAVLRYGIDGSLEYLRVNRKYIKALGMNMSEGDVVYTDPWKSMDGPERAKFKAMLDKAIETEEEQECETWRTVHSGCCGDELLCIRSTVNLIGKSAAEYIFYSTIRNVTEEKKRLMEGDAYEQKFKNLTEQANIYYWEYNVATKEMRPCFRCMRDLGLPPVVRNYPEPAIEAGIFPPDYADMYRDWHKQIAEGVPHLEAVIPLTVGRVPFRVRYTTEFDELGRPIKAYGSAAYITPGEENTEQT